MILVVLASSGIFYPKLHIVFTGHLSCLFCDTNREGFYALISAILLSPFGFTVGRHVLGECCPVLINSVIMLVNYDQV